MTTAADPKKGLELFKLARELRDTGIDGWAKLARIVTDSRAYNKLGAALGKPGLFAAALLRQPREAALSQLLARLQLPSRGDVFSISQRLTNIEMVLDDLSAAMDAMHKDRVAMQHERAVRVARAARPAARLPAALAREQ